MQHHITVTATGGLCNRMRVLASLYHLAPTLPHRIRLVWHPNSECRARFDQLFRPLPGNRLQLSAGTCMDIPANRSNLRLPALFRFLEGYTEYRDFYPHKGFTLQNLSSDRSYFFDTCAAFSDYPRELVPLLFVPVPVIQRNIRDIVDTFDDRTLGVHIRRTDHAVAIQHSPVEAFEQRIDVLLEENKFNSIFLCTDDETVRQRFKQRYGSRLLTRQVNLSRNQLSGLQDAVVDLWALANTSSILGSYYSSFSDTAAEIYGIPLELIDVMSAK